jgi:hypothetical protein
MNVNAELLDIGGIQAVYVDKHGKHYLLASMSVDFDYPAMGAS